VCFRLCPKYFTSIDKAYFLGLKNRVWKQNIFARLEILGFSGKESDLDNVGFLRGWLQDLGGGGRRVSRPPYIFLWIMSLTLCLPLFRCRVTGSLYTFQSRRPARHIFFFRKS
jgi:hypothetical protein